MEKSVVPISKWYLESLWWFSVFNLFPHNCGFKILFLAGVLNCDLPILSRNIKSEKTL